MAQVERLSKSSEHSRSPQAHNPPTFEQLFQEDVSNGWLSSSSHIHDHEQHNKKSVFTKVRETAKKLRRSLSGTKKHGMALYDENKWSSLGAKGEDVVEDNEDPEYLGAPMYESELAPKCLRETSRQHPRANPVVPENHSLSRCLKTEAKHGKEAPSKQEKERAITHSHAPKINGLTITNPNEQESEPQSAGRHVATSAATSSGYVSGRSNENGLKHSQRNSEIRQYSANSSREWDKDEKSLSQVISDSLSPKKNPGHGVVEKVKEAVSSFLWHDEQSPRTIKNTDKSSPNTSSARKPQSRHIHYTTSPVSSQTNAVGNRKNLSPNVSAPTSTNQVVKEQTRGRILQTN